MKIIEGMKQIKANKEKIADLQKKIGTYCVHMSFETPLYGEETKSTVDGWIQSCLDLAQDNVSLLVRIAKTNGHTKVTIPLGENSVTKSISEWIWRRREYAALDALTYSKLGDRGLQEGMTNPTSPGIAPTKMSIVRNYDPVIRDTKLAIYKSEPHLIDAALEVVNATTELME